MTAYYFVNPVIVRFICVVLCGWCEIEIKQGNMYSGMKYQTLKEDITSYRALTDTYLVSKLQELNEEHNYNPSWSIYSRFPRISAKLRGKSRFLEPKI